MLKIGVIGLGNIAQKAYLPVFSELQDKVEWYLSTRNEDKLLALQAKYRFPHVTTDMDSLLTAGLDAVFIHTPTPTHFAIISEFLNAGINVYVDKPVSENPAEVEELYSLATSKNVQLTTGFNRRFAPYNVELKQLTDKQLITVEKTRVLAQQSVKEAIYDLFIHVVDTALVLADIDNFTATENNFSFSIAKDANGNLSNCSMTLTLPDKTVIAKMNMQAGVDHESASIETPSGIYSVTDLESFQTDTEKGQQTKTLAGWTPMLVRRGFAPLINAFVSSLDKGSTANPVSPTSSILSHKLCQLMLDGNTK